MRRGCVNLSITTKVKRDITGILCPGTSLLWQRMNNITLKLNNTELVLCEVPPYAPDAKEGYNTILYFKRVN